MELNALLKWIVGIVTGIIVGVAVWGVTRSGSPLNPPPPPPTPTPVGIYSTGTKTVTFDGVHLPPAEPNTDGPWVFRELDLEQGRDVSEGAGDVDLQIHARTLDVTFSVSRGTKAGTTRAAFDDCQDRLSSRKQQLTVGPTRAPTEYVCLETDEGRVSRFRVVDVRRQKSGNDFVSLTLEYEYRTWEIVP